MTRAAVVVTTVLLLLVSATPILFSINDDNVNVTGTPDPSEIEIHTLDQLLLIGNNDEYPLSANYVQKDNIDFEDGDYNGGFNIDTKVTIQKNSIDDTKYDITISLHYSDTEQPSTIITTTQSALISLNGIMQEISSGNMEATFTFPSDELPDTLEISAGGIANNVPDDAWTDANKKTDKNFAIACSLTGITGATEEWGYTSNSNGNFTPIGSEYVTFTGTYDGGGFTINNLNVAVFSDSDVYSGMFGYISSTNVELKGIGLTNNSSIAIASSSSDANAFSGGLAGLIKPTGTATMLDCYATGNITATASSSSGAYAYSGGLVGYMHPSKLTIENCYTNGRITTISSSPGAYAYSGGLVGDVYAYNGTVTIQNCYSIGNIAVTSSYYVHSGGLVGHIYAYSGGPVTIQNCYAIGNITVNSSSPYTHAYSGGLVGDVFADGGTMTIQNCYAVGNIAAHAIGVGNVVTIAGGGLVGHLSEATLYIYNYYYLSGGMINNGLEIYGLKNNVTVYIDGIVSTDGTSGRTEKPSGGKTLEDLQNKETYYDKETTIPGSDPEEEVNGWSFYDPNNTEKESIWFIDEKIDENDIREPNERVNNGLPVLMSIEYKIFIQPKDVISNNVADNTFFVRSSIEGTYQWYYSIDETLIPDEEKTWTLISGATSSEYKTSDDNDIDNFYNFYRCIVTITPKQKIVSDSAQLLMGNATNITINVDGKGTVSYNDDEITTSKTYTGPYDINVPMIFKIVPDKHNTLGSVEFNGKDITLETKGDNTYILFLMIENNTLNVVFTEDQYNISISEDIVNGNISLEDNITTITNSKTCEITITPDANYIFDKIWIVEDENNKDGDPKTAILTEIDDTKYKLSNVTGDCTITATFVLKNYNVSITQSDNGSVGSSTNTMTYEGTATITITPNDGYELDEIDCGNNGTLTKINDTTYELSEVTDDCTITATFKVITIPDEEPIDEGNDNGYDVKTIFAMMYISLVLIMLIAVVLGLTKP